MANKRSIFLPGLLWVLLMLSFALSSCTSIYGNRDKGTFLYTTLGGDAKGLALTPEGATAESVVTSESFRQASDTIRRLVYAQVAGSVLRSAAQSWRSVSNAKSAAGTARVQATEATKQSAISAQAATEQAKIASETEIATTPVP